MGRRDTEPPPMFNLFACFAAEAIAGRKREQARTQAITKERKLQRRRNKRSNWTGNRQTLCEVGKLIQYRHRGPCNTDDGEYYLRAALQSLVAEAGSLDANDLQQHVSEWADRMVPRLSGAVVQDCIAEAQKRDAHGGRG